MSKLSKAISSIESGRLFSFKDDDIDSVIWHDLDTKSEISKEDIQAKMTELDDAESTKKASGKQKLKDLGLDDDEINALMGV